MAHQPKRGVPDEQVSSEESVAPFFLEIFDRRRCDDVVHAFPGGEQFLEASLRSD
jgi:hypothetical protein